MKKYYYITIIAILAILSLQVVYIYNLYKDFISTQCVQIEKTLGIAMDKELHLRIHDPLKKDKQQVFYKRTSDMTPHELDSLKRITKPGDTISILKARKEGIAGTLGELYSQLEQDYVLKKGKPINIHIVDSFFVHLIKSKLPHSFVLYDRDKNIIHFTDSLYEHHPNYISIFHPIGTKGLQYLQIKASIPMSDFLQKQIWTLSLTACFMLITLLCLLFQLVGIRRKSELLQKRETCVNGTIHDLKSPLNSVITLLSWLKMSESDTQKKRLIDLNMRNVKRTVCNIESLLILARADNKKIILNKKDISMPAITLIVKEEMDILYRNKPHTIEIINMLPEGFVVSADAMYIENALRNLVDNALKYSNDDVKVIITIEKKKHLLQMSVKDNGWGIAPQYQKKMFTQFYQVPRIEKQRQKGFGIGLTETQYIIREHGGDIKVTSAKDKGSIFTFTLPFTR